MNIEEFYTEIANLLETEYEFNPVYPKTRRNTRYLNRHPGNGRYPGRGIIRVFNPNTIHVNLYNPKLSGLYKSYDDVLNAVGFAMLWCYNEIVNETTI